MTSWRTIAIGLFVMAMILSTTASLARKTLSMTHPQLSANRKMRCPRQCQCNATSLEVDCSYKKLKAVPRSIPTVTKRLILSGNRISRLPLRTFKRLKHLEVLELSDNYLKEIPEKAFRKLRKLKTLNLSSNEIERFSPALFRKLESLLVLLLRGNKLGKLHVDSFLGLDQIREIDLSRNELQTLEVGMFSGLLGLKEVYFQENRWHCDCQLKNVDVNLRQREIRIGYLVCESPHSMEGKHIKTQSVQTFCGTTPHLLTGILLGVTYGIIALLFALFMCRTRAAHEVEAMDRLAREDGKLIAAKRARNCSRSSIISVISHQSQENISEGEAIIISDCSIDTDIVQPLTTNKQTSYNTEVRVDETPPEEQRTPEQNAVSHSASVTQHEDCVA